VAGLTDPHPDDALILIADADTHARHDLRSTLEADGYAVEEAIDGHEALRKSETLLPDVVLVDALLPEMAGLEVCAQLQTMQRAHSLPIILIVPSDDQQTIDRAFALGAADYITKPIHKPLLRYRIRQVLQNARLTRELETERSRLHRLLESLSPLQERAVQEPSSEERIAKLVAANDILQAEIVARQQAEKHQIALTTGLRRIIAITDELMTAPDADTLYRWAVELARKKLGIERCAIFLAQGDSWQGTYGTDEHGNTTDESGASFPKTEGWLEGFGTVTPYEQQWVRRDAPRRHIEGGKAITDGYGWISVTRLRAGNREIGVFFNDCAISWSELDPIQQEIVSMYCAVLGNLIERKWIEEALQHKTAYLAALNETMVEMVRRLDPEDALQSIVHRAAALVSAPFGYLYVLDPARQELVLRVGIGAFEDWVGYSLKAGEGLAGLAWKTGEVSVIDDYSQWPGRQPEFDWLHAVVCIPLRMGSEVMGVLGLAYEHGERRFGDEEIEVLARFGELVSVALQNSRLYSGIQQELAERKRVEESLRQSEERYRRLFEQIADTVFIHDLDGKILDVNEAACLHLGYARDELLRMSTHDIDAADFGNGFADRVRQQLAEGRLNNIRGVHITRDGRAIEVEVNTIVINYEGSPAILAVSRDVTEHRRVERELRHLNQIKTQLLSTAAHELRTPLTSIQGFSELLLTRDLPLARHRHFLSLINEQAAELGSIINDLLDISRLEAKGKLTLTLEPVDINELIRQVAEPFVEVASKHQIRFEFAQACPLVTGDRVRLAQVVKNLLSNAIKYSPDGGPIVVRSEARGSQIEISVQDHGIGMTPEQQRHLFEEFYRANASDTAIGGTGLGLAICKRIVELHNGTIWAESTAQVGSVFRFTLPVAMTSRNVASSVGQA
jgi:PAS domain S-box-containing protein